MSLSCFATIFLVGLASARPDERIKELNNTILLEDAPARVYQTPRFQFGYNGHAGFHLGSDSPYYYLSLESGVNGLFVFDKSFKGDFIPKRNYDSAKSNSSEPQSLPFEVETVGAKASGKTYLDNVGDTWQKIPFKQMFGSVIKFDIGPNYGYDGVFGTAWNVGKDKTPGPNASPIVNLWTKGKYQHKRFSVQNYLNVMAFVKWGDEHRGPQIPLHDRNGVGAFYVQSFFHGIWSYSKQTEAVVDTGYGVIAMPKDVYNGVLKQFSAEFDSKYGLLFVDGDTTGDDIIFEVRGQKYNVKSTFYLEKKLSPVKGKAVLAIAPSDDGIFHLGQPFSKALHVVFDMDNDSISFGKN